MKICIHDLPHANTRRCEEEEANFAPFSLDGLTQRLAQTRTAQGDVVTRCALRPVPPPMLPAPRLSFCACVAEVQSVADHRRPRLTRPRLRRLWKLDAEAKRNTIRKLEDSLRQQDDELYRQALPARPRASQQLGAKRQQQGDVVTRLADVDLQARREKLQRIQDTALEEEKTCSSSCKTLEVDFLSVSLARSLSLPLSLPRSVSRAVSLDLSCIIHTCTCM